MTEVASRQIVESSWGLWAAYLANRRQLEQDYYVSRYLGKREVYSDSAHDAQPKASVWETTAFKLRKMGLNPIVYAANLFRIVRRNPDLLFPEPKQLASPHYVDAVHRDLPRRIEDLKFNFQWCAEMFHIDAYHLADLMKRERAEDVMLAACLNPRHQYSGVFKFFIVYTYGTELMRQRAQKYFLKEASLDLFTYWNAYRKGLGEILPECLIKEAPRVYVQVLEEVSAKIEGGRVN